LLNFRMILLLALATLMGASEVCAQAARRKRRHHHQSSPRLLERIRVRNKCRSTASGTRRMIGCLQESARRGRSIIFNVEFEAARRPGNPGHQRSGGQSCGFAVVEAVGTGVSIGASYLFHRYGHHKLERWTSLVHFGLATTGAVRNYCLKTAHPRTTP